MKIDIISSKHTSMELIDWIKGNNEMKRAGIAFPPIKERTEIYRSIEPGTLQALLTLSGVAVGALLKGVFDLAKEKIIVEIQQGESCIKLEIPRNYKEEKIVRLLELLHTAKSMRILINDEQTPELAKHNDERR